MARKYLDTTGLTALWAKIKGLFNSLATVATTGSYNDLTNNLFGDIVTDLAAAITGGIGLAASGNINPEGEFPSMFEPVHGSAPDIAGLGKADPTAAILSVVLLLEHFGLIDAAAALEAACRADLASRGGASRSTSEIGDAIISRLTAQGTNA